MKQQDKNRWIEEVLGSLEGMHPAIPDEAVYNAIEQRLSSKAPGAARKTRIVYLEAVSAAAACILLLVALNIFVLSDTHKHLAGNGNDLRELVNDYHLNDAVSVYE